MKERDSPGLLGKEKEVVGNDDEDREGRSEKEDEEECVGEEEEEKNWEMNIKIKRRRDESRRGTDKMSKK